MQDQGPLQPWDDAAMTDALLSLVLELPRERLDRLRPGATPGCYIQFFATDRVAPILGSVVATGRYPAYVGVASHSLRERIGRYRQSIAGIDLIGEADIHLAVLPCASTASAHFCEDVLMTLRPVLNGLGWGSKNPGAN